MVKRIFLLTLLLFIFLLSFSYASNNYKVHIDDKLDLLTNKEEIKLMEKMKKISKKFSINLILATTSNEENKTSQAYIDDLYGAVIGDDKTGVGIVIDMGRRTVQMNTAGKMIKKFNDRKISNILDEVVPSLKSKNYYRAFNNFLSEVQSNLTPNTITFTDFIISLLGSSFIGFLYFSAVKKRYTTKEKPVYSNVFGIVNNVVTDSSDEIIDSYTYSRTIAKSSSSSSSSSETSTHTSSSGGTYGGGGKSF